MGAPWETIRRDKFNSTSSFLDAVLVRFGGDDCFGPPWIPPARSRSIKSESRAGHIRRLNVNLRRFGALHCVTHCTWYGQQKLVGSDGPGGTNIIRETENMRHAKITSQKPVQCAAVAVRAWTGSGLTSSLGLWIIMYYYKLSTLFKKKLPNAFGRKPTTADFCACALKLWTKNHRILAHATRPPGNPSRSAGMMRK